MYYFFKDSIKSLWIVVILAIFGLVFWSCGDGGGGNSNQGLAFILINDGTAYSVSKGTSTAAVITIPAIYEGLPVTTIADNGFLGYTNLTSIILPNGITKIGTYAFYQCTNLESVVIPTVVIIGNFAFDGCSSLVTVFYRGASSVNWAIVISGMEINNDPLAAANLFYYSETLPDTVNTHWLFVDGIPVTWNNYTVTFNSNGGSSFSSQIINHGGTATRPVNPTRSGYVFDNWYSDIGFTSIYNFLTPVTSNITLYAKWNEGIVSSSGIELIRISAGTYTRGSSNSVDWNASPPHQVTLTSGFYMGKYEITQEQYQEVMGNNPSYFNGGSSEEGYLPREPAAGEVQGKRPVEGVTWFDAVEFCNKLSEIEGLTPVYTITGRTPSTGYPITSATVTANWNANGYRLPTEAEWEYACRAGSTTAWHFGDDESQLVNYAWYSANSNYRTHEVGMKLPNAWGLYDMHGNVWEWCWDWYASYSSTAQTDPRGPDGGTNRVSRSGYWFSSAEYSRSADRNYCNPDGGNSGFGFRVARK